MFALLLTTRPADYLKQLGCDFWKETLLWSFSDIFPSIPIILERSQTYLQLIWLKLGISLQNYPDDNSSDPGFAIFLLSLKHIWRFNFCCFDFLPLCRLI